jgi:peptide/nickel transport system substrate-binding protein
MPLSDARRPIGTGPYIPTDYEVGVRAVLEKNTDHTWWNEGNGAWLDRVVFVDYGEDPVTWVAAAEADEIDHIYALEGDFVDVFGVFPDWRVEEIATAGTIVIRPNQARGERRCAPMPMPGCAGRWRWRSTTR